MAEWPHGGPQTSSPNEEEQSLTSGSPEASASASAPGILKSEFILHLKHLQDIRHRLASPTPSWDTSTSPWHHGTCPWDISLDNPWTWTNVSPFEDSTPPQKTVSQTYLPGTWTSVFVAGGVAGAVSRTCTAPLDRCKVILQVHGQRTTKLCLVWKQMLKDGGVASLWRGNGVNVLKIAPETAIKFLVFERAKAALRGGGDRTLSPGERMLAGASAGSFAQSCIYPMEILKTRLAISNSGQYRGIWDCARACFRAEGIKCFYKGYLPNMLGVVPYAAIDLTVYELLKEEFCRRFPSADGPCVPCLLVCGVVSSSCGQLASYPLALVRTRMQASGSGVSMCAIFRHILGTQGWRGLYVGIIPNMMKVAPAFGISYAVYESVRKKLDV